MSYIFIKRFKVDIYKNEFIIIFDLWDWVTNLTNKYKRVEERIPFNSFSYVELKSSSYTKNKESCINYLKNKYQVHIFTN